jgi:hypothetical protein
MTILWLATACDGAGETGAGGPTDTGEPNEAPVVSILSPIWGGSGAVGEALTVSGFVADDYDAPSAIALVLDSDVDGELATVPVSDDGKFDWSVVLTTAGDHNLTATATDTAGLSGSASVWVAVAGATGDGTPSDPVISFDPSEPVTGDTLAWVLAEPSVDPDGDDLTYEVTWSDGSTGETVGPVTRGDTWNVTVYATDGDLRSNAVTATVTVGNAPPTAGSVTISPETATTSTPLTCAAADVGDAEGDAVAVAYAWTVDGAAAAAGETLPAGSALAGQSVVCIATLDDGYDAVDVASAAYIMGNEPPGAPTVEVTPANPADTDELSCAVVTDAVDPDGDTVTYTTAWYRDGVVTAEAGSTVPADTTHRDEVWTCGMTATDGSGASGPEGTASVTVGIAWGGSADAAGADVTLEGAVAGGQFGKTLALVGDSDGDGLSELLVGANGEDSSTGRIYLFSGASLTGALTTADAAGSWVGEYTGAQLGGFRGVAAPGDLDGDGLAELFFAAGGDDGNGDAAGAAYLLYGGGTWAADADPGAADWVVRGTAGDECGARLAAGDVDGDGISDLVVALPQASGAARMGGAVAVFAGDGSRFSGEASSADADWMAYGDDDEDGLGWTTRIVGDIQADGYDDLFAGALYDDDGGSNAGQGGLFSGGFALSGSTTLETGADALFTGDADEDRMGYDAQGGLDFDEDGVTDLLVGAYQDDGGATDGGAVHLYYGRGSWGSSYTPSDADFSILGEDASARFGHVMASPGDVDGDGTGDLLIGAIYAAPTALSQQGAAYLVLGPDIEDAAGSSGIATSWYGTASADYFGDALATGSGDTDGDGKPEIAVGAQGNDDGGSAAGKVYVWRGR